MIVMCKLTVHYKLAADGEKEVQYSFDYLTFGYVTFHFIRCAMLECSV
jgi:hypothetical protein